MTIDGSMGEGGGQILRSAVALALVTGKAFRIEKIRAGRSKPGLLRQHLTAILAAQNISHAEVSGAEVGSRELTFHPGSVEPGDYHFAVGTAGSATLVFQSVLPVLMAAGSSSSLVCEGGTHNPFAPPYDFLVQTFLPLVERMGPRFSVHLDRSGFYPAGGGKFTVKIKPSSTLKKLSLMERGPITVRWVRALVSNLPMSIGEREVAVVREKMDLSADQCQVEKVQGSVGPGNVLLIGLQSDSVTEVITAFGEKGVSAEAVAHHAVDEARAYLAAGVPVGEHLADQLLMPLAMAGGGEFTTVAPSRHATTNLEIVKRFLEVKSSFERVDERRWLCRVG